MARIDVVVAQSLRTQPEDVVDSGGRTIVLPFLRVFGMLRVGSTAGYVCDCIIDNGAPLTVFPWRRWQHFANDVEWLTPVNTSGPTWLTRVFGRTGGHCPCRPGRVEVVAVDVRRPRRTLAPVPVIALFETIDTGDDRILVGLHGSILQRRYLHVDPDASEGWIEDR